MVSTTATTSVGSLVVPKSRVMLTVPPAISGSVATKVAGPPESDELAASRTAVKLTSVKARSPVHESAFALGCSWKWARPETVPTRRALVEESSDEVMVTSNGVELAARHLVPSVSWLWNVPVQVPTIGS